MAYILAVNPKKLNVNFDLDLWSLTLKINRVLES
jgi:hypothetical protein